MKAVANENISLLSHSNEIIVKAHSAKEQIREYIKAISKFPILTESEETHLLQDFFENQNPKAGHAVLNSHLRLVVKIAMEYKKYHQSLMDLIAEGNLGLLKALKKFSLQKQVRFSTYAALWVKASIKNFLTKSISSVKAITTNSQKKLLFNLSKAKKYLNIENKISSKKELGMLSQMLGVDEKEIRNYENMMIEIKESSINDKTSFEDESTEKGDTIESAGSNIEENFEHSNSLNSVKEKIANALSNLSAREVDIIKLRVLNPEKYTLADLANKFSISKERVRQIQAQGLNKLKKILQNEIESFKCF